MKMLTIEDKMDDQKLHTALSIEKFRMHNPNYVPSEETMNRVAARAHWIYTYWNRAPFV